MLEMRGKKQPPLKFTLETTLVDYISTTGPGGQIWN